MFPNGYHPAAKTINCCSTPFGAEVSYVSASSELLVPGRVTAATGILQGAATRPVEVSRLVGQPDVQQLSVCLDSKLNFDLDEKSRATWNSSIHWIRAVRISDDCYNFNVVLKLKWNYVKANTHLIPELVLQAVRPINAGQELLLWFSEEILSILQVVFLTPANIQGQRKYVCTRCSAMYESPNPLKLHLTLGCENNSISLFWENLASTVQKNSFKKEVPETFSFKLSPQPVIDRQKTAIDLTTTPKNPDSSTLYRPYKETSAFKPYKKEPKSSMPQTLNFLPEIQYRLPNYNDEAQIETLVSSLGKSGEGHMCLYCGKNYSRKYGLKIHIRTHTGYKPLKCKFCNRHFGDPSNLNKHVRLHAEGDTPYKCELCGKILVRRRDLRRHLKARHMVEMHPNTNDLEPLESTTIDVEENISSKESC